MKTVGSKLIVQVLPDEEKKTAGGIIIPDTAKKEKLKVKVIAVGPKVVSAEVDEVWSIHEGSGQEIEQGGEKYLVLQEMELLVSE